MQVREIPVENSLNPEEEDVLHEGPNLWLLAQSALDVDSTSAWQRALVLATGKMSRFLVTKTFAPGKMMRTHSIVNETGHSGYVGWKLKNPGDFSPGALPLQAEEITTGGKTPDGSYLIVVTIRVRKSQVTENYIRKNTRF